MRFAFIRAMEEWIRIYNDPDRQDGDRRLEKVFGREPGRFPEPVWPALPMATLMRLAFADRGNRIDSPNTRWCRSGAVVIVFDALLDQLGCSELVFVDTEYNDAEVVCLCAREWRSGRRLALWQDELRPSPPYSIRLDTLFVCYAANAELGTHIRLTLAAAGSRARFECRIQDRRQRPQAGCRLQADRSARLLRARDDFGHAQGHDAGSCLGRRSVDRAGKAGNSRLLHERR